MEKELRKLGLSENESNVYLELLKLGLSHAKPIIEKTKLHRQLVYDALESLIKKGLAGYVIQSNRKYFKASNPSQFEEYFNKKENNLKKERALFKSLLPKLLILSKSSKQEQEAVIYQGNKGIKSLLNDMMKEKLPILTIGASDTNAESFKYHTRFNLPVFHKERIENKISLKILLSKEMKKRSKNLQRLRYTSSRILPKEFTSNSSTNIYGNKVSIIMWGEEPFGIIIKSKDIAESQKKHFRLLWKIAKRS